MVHITRSLVDVSHQGCVSSPLNFVFLSCHFPPRFRYFARALKQKGVNVLGIGDESYDILPTELKDSLKEYYRVSTLEDYDQLYRAIGHFIHKYGRIHFIESLNEHWLEMEARLREDFNVEGYRPAQIDCYKRKSCMKAIFKGAGLPVAPGLLPNSLDEAVEFARQVGYPLVMKPDVGVGAEGARKIQNENELRQWWDPKGQYFLEQFIRGTIETYDGLTDHNGQIVFHATMSYSSGVMEILHGSSQSIFYYCKKEVPQDLVDAGEKVVKAFNVKSRFFHFEFFRTTEGNLLPLEVNLRPPGGITVDMWNYGHRMDIYTEYANIITRQPCSPYRKAQYICVYSSRRDGWKYKYTVEELSQKLGKRLELHTRMPKIFSPVMGDEAFVFVVDDMTQIVELTQLIECRAS